MRGFALRRRRTRPRAFDSQPGAVCQPTANGYNGSMLELSLLLLQPIVPRH
jgi:hypothetical protein